MGGAELLGMVRGLLRHIEPRVAKAARDALEAEGILPTITIDAPLPKVKRPAPWPDPPPERGTMAAVEAELKRGELPSGWARIADAWAHECLYHGVPREVAVAVAVSRARKRREKLKGSPSISAGGMPRYLLDALRAAGLGESVLAGTVEPTEAPPARGVRRRD